MGYCGEGGGCCGDWWRLVVWVVAAPHGRPVALTLGPPLNLPLGGEGNGSRERGHVVVGEGTSAMGVVGAVREPPLRVGLRERGRVVV